MSRRTVTRIMDFTVAGSQMSRKRHISEMQGSGGGGVEKKNVMDKDSLD